MVKYALLFSGRTEYRHLCDIETLYRVLINVHQFKTEHIYILLSDGSISYEYDQQDSSLRYIDGTEYTLRISDSGTKIGFKRTIEQLKSCLKDDDLLFIHTNGHGGYSSSKESTLWSAFTAPSITASYFGIQLQTLPKITVLLIMMAQCYSGGFSKAVINNAQAHYISFSCACTKTGLSIGGTEGNPFAMNWIQAMSNSYSISHWHAYKYARQNTDMQDQPIFIDLPSKSGRKIGLSLFKNTLV